MTKSSHVLALVREPQNLSGPAERNAVLFGKKPMVTFSADGGCCSVRLMAAGPSGFVGLVADKAGFTDRVRLAGGSMTTSFVVHVDARTPTVCGEARVKVLGRPESEELPPAIAEVSALLIAQAPFGVSGQVLIAVEPLGVQVDEGDEPAHGAIPRT